MCLPCSCRGYTAIRSYVTANVDGSHSVIVSRFWKQPFICIIQIVGFSGIVGCIGCEIWRCASINTIFLNVRIINGPAIGQLNGLIIKSDSFRRFINWSWWSSICNLWLPKYRIRSPFRREPSNGVIVMHGYTTKCRITAKLLIYRGQLALHVCPSFFPEGNGLWITTVRDVQCFYANDN
ncbi:hypothetical protein D3C72_1379310 [compost metagenome]